MCNTTGAERQFTWEELAKHNTPESSFVAIRDKVCCHFANQTHGDVMRKSLTHRFAMCFAGVRCDRVPQPPPWR